VPVVYGTAACGVNVQARTHFTRNDSQNAAWLSELARWGRTLIFWYSDQNNKKGRGILQ
jgi:hypothetical protein